MVRHFAMVVVQHGPTLFDTVRGGATWSDIVQHCPIRLGIVRHCATWSGNMRHGPIICDMVRHFACILRQPFSDMVATNILPFLLNCTLFCILRRPAFFTAFCSILWHYFGTLKSIFSTVILENLYFQLLPYSVITYYVGKNFCGDQQMPLKIMFLVNKLPRE